jgi:hypothetical protein
MPANIFLATEQPLRLGDDVPYDSESELLRQSDSNPDDDDYDNNDENEDDIVDDSKNKIPKATRTDLPACPMSCNGVGREYDHCP